LVTAYPITFEVLPKEEWRELVRGFFSKHTCLDPQVWKMPLELIEYAEKENLAEKFSKPWLIELLYFEWLEIEIYAQKNGEIKDYEPCENFLTENLVLNPDYKILQLEYPVYNFDKDTIGEQKGNYFVLIYRSLEDWKVYFLEINAFLATIIETIKDSNLKLNKVLIDVCKQNNIEATEDLFREAYKFMQLLESKGILLGRVK